MYSPRTALTTFTSRGDQLLICGRYIRCGGFKDNTQTCGNTWAQCPGLTKLSGGYEIVLGPQHLRWLKWEKKTTRSDLIIWFNWITTRNHFIIIIHLQILNQICTIGLFESPKVLEVYLIKSLIIKKQTYIILLKQWINWISHLYLAFTLHGY
jgi:hypothetical protein